MRGSDWNHGNNDGGSGHMGTITGRSTQLTGFFNKKYKAMWAVCWDNGICGDNYRMEEIHELCVIEGEN